MSLVERAAGFLETRVSRRNFINRSAYAGSAVAIGAGLDLALRPGTAYGAICTCVGTSCNCGSKCCAGFSEFCCSINGGYNWCPEGSIMGGWWKADNSTYCGNGPRYYMDCHASCNCTTGCGNGWGFCEPSCDGETCGCGPNGCNSYVTNCFQFRYGQCNQQVSCIGRIRCRVVACVPPWTVDPTCTTTLAVDNSTAEMNEPCWTSAKPSPPPPPLPPCPSPATRCETAGLVVSATGKGYYLFTGYGAVLNYGDALWHGGLPSAGVTPAKPVVAMAVTSTGLGYYLVDGTGSVHTFGDAVFWGGLPGAGITPAQPVVAMALTPTGLGYYLLASNGAVYPFGDAVTRGDLPTLKVTPAKPVVAMALTPTGLGYYLAGANGAIYTFGDAVFWGGLPGQGVTPAKPVVAMALTPTGLGYYLAGANGAIYTFGDAVFQGGLPGQGVTPKADVVSLSLVPGGTGYWMTDLDAQVFALPATTPFYGSAYGT